MTESMQFTDYDYIFSKISIQKEAYQSEEFKFINSTFSLYEALQDFIEYTEEQKKVKIIPNENQWYSFLRNYYNHYNSTKNVMRDFVSGNKLTKNDIQIIKNSFKWISDFLRNIFKEEEESVLPHAVNSLIAGKFYNRLFYVFKQNEYIVEEHLRIEDGKEEQLFVIDMVQKEYTLNKEIEKEVMQDNVILSTIGQEKQIQLASMWYRTVDFVEDHLTTLDKESPFA